MNTDNCVSHETIDALVKSLTYTYGRVGETTVTGCWSFLPNGFSVAYGQSACVDPESYNTELGQSIALKRCMEASRNKLWELEGYVLSKQ